MYDLRRYLSPSQVVIFKLYTFFAYYAYNKCTTGRLIHMFHLQTYSVWLLKKICIGDSSREYLVLVCIDPTLPEVPARYLIFFLKVHHTQLHTQHYNTSLKHILCGVYLMKYTQ